MGLCAGGKGNVKKSTRRIKRTVRPDGVYFSNGWRKNCDGSWSRLTTYGSWVLTSAVYVPAGVMRSYCEYLEDDGQ